MWESPDALEVSDEARRTLEGWVGARTSPQRIVMRARIVLLASQGAANRRIAREVGTSRPTVVLWRNRFVAGGGAGCFGGVSCRRGGGRLSVAHGGGLV